MKVIEEVKDNRTGTITRNSWGNVMENDLTVLISVAQIIEHQRARERGEVHVAVGRFETVAIRIEL